MDQIKINDQYINPYFILDVVETDTEKFITKSFRKKAKMWHPDKMSNQDSKDPIKIRNTKHHFKVIVESYEYIINKMRSSVLNSSNKEHITVPKSDNILSKPIDNSKELDTFNNEFNKLNINKPNDFGYTTERIKDIKDYENFEHKPYKLNFGDSKNFNKDEFNKAFEYQQEFYKEKGSGELELYHTTNDGFNAYNGSDLGGNASISSYNGIMIVGDTFGQSGIGYYDSSYSDYKKTFDGPKNPNTELDIPSEFIQKNKKKKPLTLSESKKQLELRMSNRNNQHYPLESGKYEFKKQEKILLDKQEQDIQDKLESDKNMILQYQDLFTDKNLIENAMAGNLLTNKDYCDELNINKRNLNTNFNTK
jgi:hypothetical protein